MSKASLLAWAGKAGLSEYDRHVLGGHTMKGRQVAATYSRDILAAPVRALEEVIGSVRHGNFFPDSSRANMFTRAPEKTATSLPSAPEVAGSVLGISLGSESAAPQEAPGDEPASIDDDVGGAQLKDHAENVEESGSSDSSDSSSSEVSDTVADQCMGRGDLRPELQKITWKSGCYIYKNSKTKKLHLKADGSTGGVFLCGRQLTEDFFEFRCVIATDSSKCKQCDGCKPLQSSDSVAHHIGQFLSRGR